MSSLSTIGKTAWDAWTAFQEMDAVFASLAEDNLATDEQLAKLEHFIYNNLLQ